MAYLNHNGQLINAQSFSIPANNRAFNYGDGFFESILFQNSECHIWKQHKLRIEKSADLLKIELPDLDNLQKAIDKTLKANGLDTSKVRVRLTIYRSEGGLYRPTSNKAKYLIETKRVSNAKGKDVDFGLKLAVFRDWHKPIHPLFSIKTLGAGIYVQASLTKEDLNCDDLILLNSKGNVCETTNSNIFMVSNKVVSTPPLSSGCVAGTFRSFLLSKAGELGINIQENDMTKEDLMTSDEVFLTNAISGIVSVSEIEGQYLDHKYTGFLSSLIFD